jgi:hypothetical protein
LGVGLAVVKLLIEQSGGSLTVESSPGNGTTFLAMLPRYDVGDYLGEAVYGGVAHSIDSRKNPTEST